MYMENELLIENFRCKGGWWQGIFIFLLLISLMLISLVMCYAQVPNEVLTENVRTGLIVGKSKVFKFEDHVLRASITDPKIADVVVLSPTEILINGKTPGTTSLIVWSKKEDMTIFDISVTGDVSTLDRLLKDIEPKENIAVHSADKSIVLSGVVEREDTINKATEVAKSFSENVVNLMFAKEPQQIMLEVRFAEVNRSAAKEFGLDATLVGKRFIGQTFLPKMGTDYKFTSANVSDTELDYSKLDTLFNVWGSHFDLLGLFKNLESKGLLRILAEPNLLTASGKEASFLAGGEFPILITTSVGGIGGIQVMFKEYGVKLNFTPTVRETGSINLKVKPEVSILDWASAPIKISGFNIPGLITRRAETTVELNEDETLIIGGLISQDMTKNNSKLPFLSDMPILGKLFTSEKFQKNETELIVLVTPRIVRATKVIEPRKPLSTEDIPKLFRLEEPPYEHKQGDEMREGIAPYDEAIRKALREAEIEEEKARLEAERKAKEERRRKKEIKRYERFEQ